MWIKKLRNNSENRGQVVVPIGTVADGKSHDQWYKLMPRKKENVSGELRLRIQYLSASVCVWFVYFPAKISNFILVKKIKKL